MNTQSTAQKTNYFVPFIIMVVLMSLVGLITNLNQQFQGPMQAAYLIKGGSLTSTFTTLLTFSFFLAYLIMGPISARYIEKHGYKRTLILGLTILCIAFGIYMLSAWIFESFDRPNFQATIDEARSMGDTFKYTGPIELPIAYWVFLIAAYVAGTALTYLQAVINPYIVACDVKGTTGVQRQSIAGTGNSLMTTLGPLFVAFVIFQGAEGLDINISSLYLPIAILMLLVLVIVFTLPKLNLPEIASVSSKGEKVTGSVFQFRHVTLGLVAIFFYVGVEVCVGANINLYANRDLEFSMTDAAKLASLYWGGMLVGRFIGSFLSKVSAKTQLTVASIGAMILVIASMFTGNPWLLCGVGLFHSIMWPAIFALAMEGLGRFTAKASGVLMMGCFGGALLPLLQGMMADSLGAWNWTWLLVVVGEIYILYYALAGSKVLKRDVQA